jgi:hypothetical protein
MNCRERPCRPPVRGHVSPSWRWLTPRPRCAAGREQGHVRPGWIARRRWWLPTPIASANDLRPRLLLVSQGPQLAQRRDQPIATSPRRRSLADEPTLRQVVVGRGHRHAHWGGQRPMRCRPLLTPALAQGWHNAWRGCMLIQSVVAANSRPWGDPLQTRMQDPHVGAAWGINSRPAIKHGSNAPRTSAAATACAPSTLFAHVQLRCLDAQVLPADRSVAVRASMQRDRLTTSCGWLISASSAWHHSGSMLQVCKLDYP